MYFAGEAGYPVCPDGAVLATSDHSSVLAHGRESRLTPSADASLYGLRPRMKKQGVMGPSGLHFGSHPAAVTRLWWAAW